MRRRSRAVGEPAKAQRRKTGARKSRIASKAADPISSSGSDEKTKVARLTRERDRALEQQRATADVLKVVSRSGFDLQLVFETLVESAAKLCKADFADIWRPYGPSYRVAATYQTLAAHKEYLTNLQIKPSRGSCVGRTLLDAKIVHIHDIREDAEYALDLKKLGERRTMLGVPLLRDEKPIGVIALTRSTVRPFTTRQIDLVTTFADQAVIAIENTRLLNELRERTGDLEESLIFQTATSDVLKVISRSTFDLQQVLDTLIQTAAELCETGTAAVAIRQDDVYRYVATARCSPEWDQALRSRSLVPGRDSIVSRVLLERKVVHIVDAETEPGYDFPNAINIGRVRTLLGVPMFREDEVVGVIGLSRQHVEPFTERQIELMRTFAAQAVIAMQNARLLGELRERTTDLTRSVDELTATGDVLKIISRSSVDLETVLDTLVETVARLCRADQAYMWRSRGNVYQLLASCGLSEDAKAYFLAHPPEPGRGTVSGRVALEGRSVHIPDVLKDPEYTYTEAQKVAGFRTILGVPLVREHKLLGIFSLNRNHADPFTAKEIELASTFADQAVIAIENARLFDELRERQAELRVTFDNMGDGVVMFDAQARLTAWNRNFQDILDLPDAFLAKRPSYADYFRYLAERGEYAADLEAELSRTLEDTSREMRFERTRPGGRVIEVRRNPVPGGGFVLIYSDITERKRAEEATRTARDAAETALRELQAAQTSLLHAQKMAALGQLTAGIAHEIKNPLNFVNNFSALSAGLVDEMNDVLQDAVLAGKKREELDEIRNLLKSNLEKVVQHGKRADSIVKNMLLHSRVDVGERRPADINALVGDSLNLAYHGARAEKTGFSITLKHDLDPEVGAINLYPQEITRALLNLISNGFYAATRRKVEAGDDIFEPVLSAATRNLGPTVEIRIRDNGTGIPPEVREKMFNPFFTTKPTGEGTGLGLSMTHDIIVKQHGGRIDVETEPGVFTEIIITLPRDNGTAAGQKLE
ncbi:MAG TPA: GAF domain-containing protein [Steroidobacteraceae bacterium]|jgi:two-component system NtrC family sensor kinase|nr:GAF domain-containing protein [Steroidobacteraceae bacterium]